MTDARRPRLRPVQSAPFQRANGEIWFLLQDPSGFAGAIEIPEDAARVASLMDGVRDCGEIEAEFKRQFGFAVHSGDVADLVEKLDERWFLDSERFRARWKSEVETYLNLPTRPAAHAGAAYAGQSAALTAQLEGLFAHRDGPGPPGAPGSKSNGRRLAGILSPHIDLHRGGPAFAWAYRRLVEESDADLFVIFGTAHQWMRNPFSVSKKHFDTPLGVVQTDKEFVARLARNLAAQPGGQDVRLYADELAHRTEHSIEFQAVFLQHLLGEHRQFQIVPILVGSFHQFVRSRRQPSTDPAVQAFVAALRATVDASQRKVCFIAGGDLAHIGPRFGDRDRLDRDRLERQADSDRQLLAAACRPDAAGFFDLVAAESDRNRICGLSPMYTMLEVMRPGCGEFLTYGQAADAQGTSCVSFGSLAFYEA